MLGMARCVTPYGATGADGLQPPARIIYDTMVLADMTGAPFALCRRTDTRVEET